jgi:AraC-like DNA-binding protein
MADTSRHFLVNHCRLVTDNLDHARDVVGRAWEEHSSHLRRGTSYSIRWHQADMARMSLSYVSTEGSIRIACGAVSDSVRLSLYLSGGLRYRIDGRNVQSTATRGVVYGPGQDLEMETERFRRLIVTFDGAMVRNALQRWADPIPPMDRWTGEIPLTSSAGVSLRSLALWVAEKLDHHESDLTTSGRTADAVQRTLLNLFLDCVTQEPLYVSRGRDFLAENRTRRIEEWIDAHLSEPIGIDDIADAFGINVRTIQMGFRRYHGCTPMQMVTRRRLEAARRILFDPSSVTTVTGTAMDCGFFHMGRFATRYRQAFGETPSETLAKARKRRA